MVRKDATPISGNASSSSTTGQSFTLIGADITLTQADLPYAVPPAGSKILQAATDVFIYADTVRIASALHNPGRNLQIVARSISIGAGASIDVSGADAAQNFAPGDTAQQTDESPGANGVDGADGTEGGNAGTLTLYAESFAADTGAVLTLTANGAEGGRGQDGHDGIAGGPGTWVPRNPWRNGDIGGGQPGGNGGQAGNAGNGGAAGSITIGIVNGASAASFAMSAVGGARGVQGAMGQGGVGGHGAPYDPRYNQYKGPEGDYGFSFQLPPNRAAAGANGTTVLQGPPQFGYAQLSAVVVLAQLSAMQQTADAAFLSRDFVTAANLYHLLMELTAGAAGTTTGGAASATPPSDPDTAARAAIYEGSRTELSRMRQGLDFFGNAPDWAPTLTLSALQGEIDGLLNLAAQLESAFAILSDNTKSADDRRKSLTDAQARATAALQAAQSQLTSAKSSITSYESSLSAQDLQIATQIELIDQYDNQFEHDFENDHDGCTVSHALNAIQTCVTVGTSLYAGASDLADAGEAVEGAYEAGSVVDGLKNGIKFVQTSLSTYDAMKNAYSSIQQLVTPDYPDIAKMFVNQADFDASMAQYVTQYASGEELKEAVDHYYDLVKARGQTVLNYNAMYLQRHRLEAECDQRQAAFEVTQAQLAADTEVTNPGYAAFVQNADAQCRLYLLRKITEEQRAYAYWTLDEDGEDGGSAIAPPTDDNLATLQSVHEAIVKGIDDWRNGVGRPFEAYTAIQITFTREDHPSAFAALDTLQRLVITADIDADGDGFANMFHVIAEKLRVNVSDAQGQAMNDVTANVVHGGMGTFRALDGTTRSFTHALRVTYCSPHADGALGDPTQGYTGLSPFTEWSIDLSYNKAFFAKGATPIASVTLEFDGQFLGPDALVRMKQKLEGARMEAEALGVVAVA